MTGRERLSNTEPTGGTMGEYSIVALNAQKQHDPLEEALQRLDDAYVDAVNMAIAHNVFSRIMTEEEGRQLFEQQRQVWLEVRL